MEKYRIIKVTVLRHNTGLYLKVILQVARKSSKVSSSQIIAMNKSPYEVRISLQNTVKDKS